MQMTFYTRNLFYISFLQIVSIIEIYINFRFMKVRYHMLIMRYLCLLMFFCAQAEVRSITDSDCQATYGPMSSNIICVREISGVTCSGDSGGFLGNTVRQAGRFQQDGVTSFGAQAGCGLDFPEGYTEVFRYLGWIQQNTGITP